MRSPSPLLALGALALLSTFLLPAALLVAADCTTYAVKSGDTCFEISNTHGISLSDFQSWNPGINCGNLQIGQTVCISRPTTPSPPSGGCVTHTIVAGDICFNIAQQYGVSVDDLQRWNPGLNCQNLQVGQVICVSQPPPAAPPPPAANYNGKVFSEYIGALFNGVRFTDVPIRSDVTFYFILSFAIDYTYADAKPTNGIFDIYWQNSVLTPAAVSAIKAQHSNVKVLVSLGGDTINGQPVVFHASSIDSWVTNAVASLTSIIKQYHLDGIDIDYEHFDNVPTQTFVTSIGRLIKQLKDSGVISVATIAPFDGVETQYRALWDQYNTIINYVNFQFYSYSASTTAAQYVNLYHTAAAKYGGGKKVLASFSTGGVGPPPATVLTALEQLKANGRLPGIFIFSADGSFVSSAKFQYEEEAQALVAR